MKNNNLWFDSIAIDGDKAWSVGNTLNAIFCIDMNTGICKYRSTMPDFPIMSFRKNQYCIKIEDDVYCFPDVGDNIWIYNINNGKIKKISVENTNKCRIGIYNIFRNADKVYAISGGLNRIIEIDTVNKNIANQYIINSAGDKDVIGENAVRVGDSIFFLLVDTQKIGEFNIETKEMILHPILHPMKEITAMCYDGEYFWLSGKIRELYRWDIKNDEVIVLKELPYNFCVYGNDKSGNFTEDCNQYYYDKRPFRVVVDTSDYVWLIPDIASQILYINKSNLQINYLEIGDRNRRIKECEREEHVQYKYEYMRNKRFIGLYSFLDEKYLEIDTKKCEVIWKDYYLDTESKSKIWDIILQHNTPVVEHEVIDLSSLICALERKSKHIKGTSERSSTEIYKALMAE